MTFKSKPATLKGEDKEWLAAVGLMAVYWADCEIMMDTYIAVLLTHPSASALCDPSIDTQTALDITFNKRIRMWRDLTAILPLDEATRKNNLDLSDRVRDARNHRDLLLHGETRRYPDGQMKANHLPRKEHQKVQHVPYPTEKVLKVAGEILHLNASITHLMIQTMAWMTGAVSENKSGA